jgi:membrane fusion protein (multidrug efflux system)
MKTALRNILILLLIGVTLAVIYWLIINYYDDKNRTDDAQVDSNIVPCWHVLMDLWTLFM